MDLTPTTHSFQSLGTLSDRQHTLSSHSLPPVTDNRLQTKKPLKIVNFQWQIIYLTALNFFSPDECHKYGECRDTAYNRKQSERPCDVFSPEPDQRRNDRTADKWQQS